MHIQNNTPRPLAHFRVIRWRVTRAHHASQLREGDIVVYDPSKPKHLRVTVERASRMHAGDLDRLQMAGALAPIGGTLADHRAGLVMTLVRDRQMQDAA